VRQDSLEGISAGPTNRERLTRTRQRKAVQEILGQGIGEGDLVLIVVLHRHIHLLECVQGSGASQREIRHGGRDEDVGIIRGRGRGSGDVRDVGRGGNGGRNLHFILSPGVFLAGCGDFKLFKCCTLQGYFLEE
jgi:hypothetical protein